MHKALRRGSGVKTGVEAHLEEIPGEVLYREHGVVPSAVAQTAGHTESRGEQLGKEMATIHRAPLRSGAKRVAWVWRGTTQAEGSAILCSIGEERSMTETYGLVLMQTAKAKPGKEEELRKFLVRLITASRHEPGNISFELHESKTSPERSSSTSSGSRRNCTRNTSKPRGLRSLPRVRTN